MFHRWRSQLALSFWINSCGLLTYSSCVLLRSSRWPLLCHLWNLTLLILCTIITLQHWSIWCFTACLLYRRHSSECWTSTFTFLSKLCPILSSHLLLHLWSNFVTIRWEWCSSWCHTALSFLFRVIGYSRWSLKSTLIQ